MSKYIGDVSAYAYAVSKGYTGTEEEFAELMADYADVGQRAEDAADSALNSKTAAQTAAQTATTKAGEASTSATSASSSASAASASASAAFGSATSAAASATAASGSATAAAGSATTASTKAAEASASATDAATAKTGAEAAQTAAETAQGKAEDAQEAAETTAQSISASATQIATNAADITQLKSEVSALPTDGVVANSKQLLSENGTDNTEPYMFRAVPVNADRAELDAVVGGTVVWNQLIPNIEYTKTNNGVTITSDSNGLITLSGTSTKESGYINFYVTGKSAKLLDGHAYLFNVVPKVDTGTTNMSAVVLLTGNGGLLTCYNKNGTVVKQSGAPTDASAFYVRPSYTFDGTFAFYCGVIDLTAMFGSTIADYIYQLEQSTAGAGVAFFRKLFPKDYYPYDAGTLKSVEGVSSHDMVGFNQWDEEWEVGYYNDDGTPVTNANRIRSKNRIRVLPNTTYYVDASVNNYELYVLQYTEDGTFISKQLRRNNTFTTDDNAFGILFFVVGISSYNHDICINLSDPVKNGTYEPYVKHSYPLDNTLTLRGIPKLADGKLAYDGDRYLPDGTVERQYGIVDLGTLTWSTRATGTVNALYSSALPSEYVGQNTVVLMRRKMIGDKKDYQGPSTATTLIPIIDEVDVGIYSYINGGANTKTIYAIIPVGENITDAGHLVYELADPTTETAEPYQSLQVCDPNGTEEFVSTGIVPVGHETRYPENLRAKIEGLPWDFSSLIAPTEKTTTASRNYTTGSLLIMGNVLYKATANIANGGTITPGTNVTATTLSEVISALQ